MLRITFILTLALSCSPLGAAESQKSSGELKIFPRDLVNVTVQGEPDVAVDRQIDAAGTINVPLLGSVAVAGLTVSEAQELIAKRYREEEIFIQPEVVFTITGYAPKEATLLGQVAKQGKILFPAESSELSVVEAIASAGGLTRIAKGDAVRITRRDQQGVDQNFTVNVDRMIDGRGATAETFYLQPGDIVFVPERVF